MRYIVNQFEIDTQQYTLSREGDLVAIEPKVFDLVVYLIEHRQRLISRDELFDKLWAGREVSDTTLSNHIKSARKSLGDSAEHQAVIKTLRGRGYQFIGAVEVTEDVRFETETVKVSETTPHQVAATRLENTNVEKIPSVQPASPLQTRLYQLVIAVLLLAIAGLVAKPLLNNDKQIAELTSLKRIAVLPLQNLHPNAKTDYLGFAIADQIIGELSTVTGLTVRGSGSVRQYQGQAPAPEAVAESLSIDYLLNGTYLRGDKTLTLHIELININTHQLMWRETVTAPAEQAFTLQRDIALKLSQKLHLLGAKKTVNGVKALQPSDALAYELYLRAISAPETNQGATMAIEMLNQAHSLDSDYAPILIALGQRTHFLALFNLGSDSETERAINYYNSALALAPQSQLALSSLAKIYAETGKTSKAIELSRKIIQLNDQDAQAHFALGYSYRYAGMIEQSIEHIETALRIDPNSRWSHTLSISYISIEQYDKALEALEVGADTPYSLGWKAAIYLHQGKHGIALQYLDRVIEMEPDSFWEYDSQGFKAFITQDIERGLNAVKKLEAADVKDSEATFYWATIYALLEDKESALRMLNKAVDNGYFNYPLFQRETHLDALRQDARFQQLLNRVKDKHMTFKQQYF